MSIEAPNFTQIPNSVLDAMPSFSEPELRIILAIARQTFGWHRESAILSISFLQKATGLSNRAIVEATKKLVVRKIVSKTKTKQLRGASALMLVIADPLPTFIGQAPDLLPTVIGTSERRSQVPMNDVHTNKETLKETVKKVSPDADAPGDDSPEAPKLDAKERQKQFVKLWHDNYPEHFERPYEFGGGKDFAALKRFFTSSDRTAESLLMTAVAAWKNRKLSQCFWCRQHSASIASFISRLNEIEAECNSGEKTKERKLHGDF